jgi:hypothetical protein
MHTPVLRRPQVIAALAALVALTLSTGAAWAAETAWQKWFADGTLDDFQVVSGSATYRVEDGVLIGTTTEGSPNTFLATKKPLRDFEIEFEVNVDEQLNSGLQVRSHLGTGAEPLPWGFDKKPPAAGRLYGPQCEIGGGGSGDFYDEARKGTWWSELADARAVRTPEAKQAFKAGQWNAYRIVVQGDHYRSWINGVPTADFRQPNDPEGHIGFQVHGIKKGTGPYSVRWRNVRFRPL